MGKIVFLVEEESMKTFLATIEPSVRRLLNLQGKGMLYLSFKGKDKLRKKAAKQIRAYRDTYPDCRFVVLCDQDADDCKALKKVFQDIIDQCGVAKRSRIRIVCKELEAWLLGDRPALEAAFPNSQIDKKAYANPDNVSNPKKLVLRKTGSSVPTKIARQVGSKMSVDSIKRNRSASFRQFVSGLALLVKKHPGSSQS